MKKVAAIIARVSTGVQDYQRQLEDLQALAKSMGYLVPPEYVYSEKISGFTKGDEREALSRIIEEIKTNGKIDMVFAESASRIARKPSVGHKFVEDLTELGIPVYISNMNCASLERGNRNKGFFLQYAMLLEFANIDAEDIKSKFKSGKLQSVKEGRVSGGDMLIYGYKRGPRVEGDRKASKYVIDEYEGKIVKKIFELSINGAGTKLICNYLNENNIPSKSGKLWLMGTLTRMLNNPFYYGTRRYKGKVYENVVPAIITKETFDLAKRGAIERNVNPEKNVKYLYLLKNKAYCGYCGSSFIAKFRPKKHSHYMCYNRSSNKPKVTCTACGIGIDRIESLVWSIVKANLGIYNYLQKHNDVIRTAEKDIANLNLKLKSYKADIETKTGERKKWNRLFVTGKIDEDELNVETGKIDKSITNLEFKIKSTKADIEARQKLTTKGNNIEAYKGLVNEIGKDRVKINEVLDKVLDKVIITSTKQGANCNTFIVTVYMFGLPIPTSVYFDKTTLEYWYNPQASAGVKYSAKGVLQNDLDKLEKGLKKPYTGKTVKGIEFVTEGATKVEHIPFTRLNTLKGFEEVPIKKSKK